jgi:mono/diheme cytochrome c family protein
VHDDSVKRLGLGLLVAVVAACAANGVVVPDLDADAERGRQVSLDEGCAVCHGQYGQGGAAGSFYGLWGSEVELDDGTVVTADADYLRRAIVDPTAEIVAGSSVEMPAVPLTDEQVDDLLTWIEALADQP